MIQSFPAQSTPASQNLGGTSSSWVGPRDLPSGALALGKGIAGPSPNLGPPPGQHKGGIFLSLVYRVCSRLRAFLGYEIHSIRKDHLRSPKKVRCKDRTDWSFIFVQNNHELWKLGEQPAFVEEKKRVWIRSTHWWDHGNDSEKTIELWERLSNESLSLPGVLQWGVHIRKSMTGGYVWVNVRICSMPWLEVLGYGCQRNDEFLYNLLWGKSISWHHPMEAITTYGFITWSSNRTSTYIDETTI